MRHLSLLILLLPLVSACGGSRPYTGEDLHQVREGYAMVPPIYRSFKAAYLAQNTAGIRRYYRREQRACHIVDDVDHRDTIDPNVNLFAVSAGLDTLCNDIETAYAQWAKAHGYPYDKSLPPSTPQDVFVDGDASLEKMPDQIKHPAALA